MLGVTLGQLPQHAEHRLLHARMEHVVVGGQSALGRRSRRTRRPRRRRSTRCPRPPARRRGGSPPIPAAARRTRPWESVAGPRGRTAAAASPARPCGPGPGPWRKTRPCRSAAWATAAGWDRSCCRRPTRPASARCSRRGEDTRPAANRLRKTSTNRPGCGRSRGRGIRRPRSFRESAAGRDRPPAAAGWPAGAIGRRRRQSLAARQHANLAVDGRRMVAAVGHQHQRRGGARPEDQAMPQPTRRRGRRRPAPRRDPRPNPSRWASSPRPRSARRC